MSAIDQLRQLLATGQNPNPGVPVLKLVIHALIDQHVAISHLTAAVKALEEDETTISGPAV